MKWLLCVVVVVLAGVVRADEIRWINPQGGDWNEPGNWDLGRVPGEGDVVIVDIAAEYSIHVKHAIEYVESISILDGIVSLDLGGTFIPEIVLMVMGDGTRSPIVTFANGSAESGIVVGDSGGTGRASVIFGINFSGMLGTVEVHAGSHFATHHNHSVNSLLVHDGGFASVGDHSRLSLYLWAQVDGSLSVNGHLDVLKATLSGTGHIAADGGDIEIYQAIGGLVVHPVGSCSIRIDYLSNVSIDLLRATEQSLVSLGAYSDGSALNGVDFIVKADSHGDHPFVTVHSDDGQWRFDDIVMNIRGSSDLALGEYVEILWLDLPIGVDELTSYSCEFLIQPECDSCIGRFGSMSGRRVGVSVLKTRSEWCAADLDLDGDLDFFDVARFLSEYGQQSPWANLNNDLRVDFFDVAEFLAIYTGGCP